jgi:prevent-host-death family protein
MSSKVSVYDAKTHISRLMDEAMEGEEVIITRSGRPMVKLTPVVFSPAQRKLGTAKGEIRLSDDFDSPLSNEMLAEFEKGDL